MLQEAIERLIEVGRSEVRVIELPESDPNILILDAEGHLTERSIPPTARRHTVYTVQGLIDAAVRWSDETGAGDGGVIWLGQQRGMLVIDDDDRRDLVELPLKRCKLFDFLLESDGKKFDQTQMIRVLRTTLANSIGKSDILAAVRKIKWRRNASGEVSVNHGNESMGQTIENEVSGSSDIPDTLVVTTPVYSNLGERDYAFPVALDVEILPTEQRFVLRPIGDALEVAAQAGLVAIAERIGAALPKVPIFFGSP